MLDDGLSWKGNNRSLSGGTSVCAPVRIDTSNLQKGEFSYTFSINHNGAHSPTPVSLAANIDSDTDGDGIADGDDTDDDGDGVPDSEDGDRDGDGFINDADIFPDDASEWFDSDGDGIGNNKDINFNPSAIYEGYLINGLNRCSPPIADTEVVFEIDGKKYPALMSGEAMKISLPKGVHVVVTYKDSQQVSQGTNTVN